MLASVGRIESALATLAQRPGTLAALALAINAIVQPYLGLVHDARLYSLLVNNRITGGAYGHDLFLVYGSQDSFSLFSFFFAPLAASIGLPLAFFLGYLVVRAVFFFALSGFVVRLFGATPMAALAVLVLALDPIAFGGHQVFHINEPFLTPRLPAVAMTLFGLTAMLERKWIVAGACCLVGCLLHPIMAIVGFPLVAGWMVMASSPRRGFGLLVGVSGAALALLAIGPLGYRIFGAMDREWLERVRLVAMYQFPFLWREADLVRTLYVAALVAFAAWSFRESLPQLSRFASLALLVGLGGLLVTTVASEAGYRLLHQAQLSRAMWIVHLLAPACLVHVVIAAWSQAEESPRWMALAWVVLGLALTAGVESWWLAMLLLPLALVGVRGLDPVPRSANWGSTAAAIAVVFGQVASGLIQVGLGVSIIAASKSYELLEYLSALWLCLGLPVLLVLVLVLLDRLAGRLQVGYRRVAFAAVAVAILWQSGVYAVAQTSWYRAIGTRDGTSPEFVGRTIAKQEATTRTPTVYWTGARVERIWLEARACSYFEFLQMAGLMFNRETAIEGTRRARAVGAFELEHFRTARDGEPVKAEDRKILQRLYGGDLDEASVDAESVTRLAQEPGLDYIVVRRDLGLPYLATDGRVYVIDCRQLRGLAAR